MSHGLYEAVLLSSKNIEKARKDINIHIAPKALKLCGIVPLRDVNSTLWKMAADILRGKAIKIGEQ